MWYVDHATQSVDCIVDISSPYCVHTHVETDELRLKQLFALDPHDTLFLSLRWPDIARTVVHAVGPRPIMVSLSESHAVLAACDAARSCCDVSYVWDSYDPPQGGLLFISYVHPLTGICAPLEEIAEQCLHAQCLLAVDISAALGSVSLDVVWEYADFLMIRGGSVGLDVSCLFARHALPEPCIYAPSTVARCYARLKEIMQAKLLAMTEVMRMRLRFEHALPAVPLLGDKASHISCVRFPHVHSEFMLFALAQKGVYASRGGGDYPLLASLSEHLHCSPAEAMTYVSFAFSPHMIDADIDDLARIVSATYRALAVYAEGL